MSSDEYAKDITAEDLHIFLNLWPSVFQGFDEIQQSLADDQEKFLGNDAAPISWCHLYELPIKEHLVAVLTAEHLPRAEIAGWLGQIVAAPSQFAALPAFTAQVDTYFESIEDLSKEQADELRKSLAQILCMSLSTYFSLKCVMYHGCYLNELIERVRTGDDKALFDAIRIDSTIIGCKSVVERISKAAFLKENRFFAKLKAAINGKMAKREQANFQKMRLVLEVLHEVGASRLSDSQLHQLFAEELDLYASNAKGGGNTKALRKFADTYMKKSTTT